MKIGRMILGTDANIQHALMCARKDIEKKKSIAERDYSKFKEDEKKEAGITRELLDVQRGVIQGLKWALDSVDDIRQSKSYRNRITDEECEEYLEQKRKERIGEKAE